MSRSDPRLDRLPRLMTVAAAVVLLAALVCGLAVPKPSAARSAAAAKAAERRMRSSIDGTQAGILQAKAALQPRLWDGPAQAITAAIMGRVTTATNAHGVKLTGFRPQKTRDLDGITELAFSAHLAGDYPAVQAALADLEAPANRMAIEAVQTASSDAASHAVTASISLTAYTLTDASGRGTEGGKTEP